MINHQLLRRIFCFHSPMIHSLELSVTWTLSLIVCGHSEKTSKKWTLNANAYRILAGAMMCHPTRQLRRHDIRHLFLLVIPPAPFRLLIDCHHHHHSEYRQLVHQQTGGMKWMTCQCRLDHRMCRPRRSSNDY